MRKRLRGLLAYGILVGMMFVPLGCGSSGGDGGTGTILCNTSAEILRLQPLSDVPDEDDVVLGPVFVEVRPPDGAQVQELPMMWDGTMEGDARVWRAHLTGIIFDKRYRMLFHDRSHRVRPNGNPMPSLYPGGKDRTPEGRIRYNGENWPFGSNEVRDQGTPVARIEPIFKSENCSIEYFGSSE